MNRGLRIGNLCPYNRGMDSLSEHLVRLAEKYAERKNVRLWRIGHLAAGRGGFFVDLRNGRQCQTRTYLRTLQWLSDHWPDGLAWPSDIPRPPRRTQTGEAA